MAALLDVTGSRFGRLTALSKAPNDRNNRTRWLCRCDCGAEKVVDGAHMRYGRINSCGCLQVETAPEHARRHLAKFAGHNRRHGMSKHPVYAVWKTMNDRCRNPKNKRYADYGGRGIKICERWRSFEKFLVDMGERPAGLTLERDDVNGDYEPGNCRWATWSEQNLNKRFHGKGKAASSA